MQLVQLSIQLKNVISNTYMNCPGSEWFPFIIFVNSIFLEMEPGD